MHTFLQQQKPVIGTGDFAELIDGGIFVDKTLLIKDLLMDRTKASLITRPRRWGKTLNMNMLYHFLRCEVRKNVTTNELETISPHPGLFDNLNIGEAYPELITSHQGKWPVMFLNFKDLVGGSVLDIEKEAKVLFQELYSQHAYLSAWLHSLGKTPETLVKAKYFSDVLEKKADLTELENSLYFLSRLLYEYHGQRVFVLLDEYDAPLNNTFLKPTLYERILAFMRGLLGKCFKDNAYLEKGIMTGILRVAKADLFSGLNNFKEYSLLDKRYAEQFGFTDAEVSDLFEQPHVRELIQAPAPDPEDIKAWYNGYTIGGMTIYNPWSIMYCISEGGTLAPYWVNTGSDTLLRKLLKGNGYLVHQIEQLLANDRIQVDISPHINMMDMDADLKFWSLMLAAGYVTLAGDMSTFSGATCSCWVRIPNAEVRVAYESLIVGWFGDQVGGLTSYKNMVRSLFRGEVELFSEAFNGYIAEATSCRNTGLSKAEQYYSGFMAGLLIVIQKDFAIHSEAESGAGYADMLAIPRAACGKVAVVFEYKIAHSKEALAGKVQEALDQIDKKEYVMRVKSYQHIATVMKVGIAFHGKEVLVESKITQLG